MKTKILFLVLPHLLMAGLFAQTQDERLSETFAKFKPRYAGTSVSTGFMFTSGFGSAFYVAPQFNFQLTPRLFVHSGISMVQYSLMPSQVNETFRKRTMTDTYIYAAGTYLLNEKWSLNGSVMKSVTPKSVRTNSPLSPPTEAMHFGVDYRITPHVTVGAKIGYSNGSNTFKQSYFPY